MNACKCKNIFICASPHARLYDYMHSSMCMRQLIPDSNVHGVNKGPTWILSAPDGPHVGPWTLLSGIHWKPPVVTAPALSSLVAPWVATTTTSAATKAAVLAPWWLQISVFIPANSRRATFHLDPHLILNIIVVGGELLTYNYWVFAWLFILFLMFKMNFTEISYILICNLMSPKASRIHIRVDFAIIRNKLLWGLQYPFTWDMRSPVTFRKWDCSL